MNFWISPNPIILRRDRDFVPTILILFFLLNNRPYLLCSHPLNRGWMIPLGLKGLRLWDVELDGMSAVVLVHLSLLIPPVVAKTEKTFPTETCGVKFVFGIYKFWMNQRQNPSSNSIDPPHSEIHVRGHHQALWDAMYKKIPFNRISSERSMAGIHPSVMEGSVFVLIPSTPHTR